jgi:pimeloyl-ACP methyl ester carboxylesterase
MAAVSPVGPAMPDALERHRDTSTGRMRSRTVGERRAGVPEVVVVQGMAVADYLMPAVAELGRWTRAHLVELPGYAGSGEAVRPLDVPGYGAAVAEWVAGAELGAVVLVGHSSGTQVAARAAAAAEGVVGVVLASPTVAPTARPLPRLLWRWRQDGRNEPPGLTPAHLWEWRRPGIAGLLHLIRVHLRDRIEDTVPTLDVPLLVLRGSDDRLTTTDWARSLADGAPAGHYLEVLGAHTFPWADPTAWSEPIRRLALGLDPAPTERDTASDVAAGPTVPPDQEVVLWDGPDGRLRPLAAALSAHLRVQVTTAAVPAAVIADRSTVAAAALVVGPEAAVAAVEAARHPRGPSRLVLLDPPEAALRALRAGPVSVPVLVARTGPVVMRRRRIEDVVAGQPDGRFAVVDDRGRLRAASPAAVAAAILPFLGGPPPGPDAPTALPAPASVADFDSATAILRGVAASVHGRDLPALGAFSRPVAHLAERVLPAVNTLPTRLREEVYRRGSGAEAVDPARLHAVSAEAVARWMVGHYPQRRYPAVVIGSSNGALAHLAAALGAPYLPQTFLLPVRQPRVHPDDPRAGLAAGRGPGRIVLDSNPDVALHHMHDPNQDRLSLARMTYFRLKRRRLGPAFTGFLTDSLPRSATLVVADGGLRWPVTRLGDRYVFQFGAFGGMPPQDYRAGGDRVADHLRRHGSYRRGWDPPPADDEAPEAEWGLDPALLRELEDLADRRGWRLCRIPFDEPDDLSGLVAELYRWWYHRHRRPADRLLVEQFVLLDPHLALTRGLVPYWSAFPVDASADALERHLDAADDAAAPYDEIRMTLFSHGTQGVGLAGIDRWRSLLGRARHHGAFLGVDPERFPRDFAGFVRFSRELRALGPPVAPPPALTTAELEQFLDRGR